MIIPIRLFRQTLFYRQAKNNSTFSNIARVINEVYPTAHLLSVEVEGLFFYLYILFTFFKDGLKLLIAYPHHHYHLVVP